MSAKKIIQRRGLFEHLPILSSGEIGYATNDRRMFIGNDIITRTGTGIADEIYDFNIPLHHMQNKLYSIFKNDEVLDAGDYVVLSTGSIKFTAVIPTSDTVVLKYNTEIPIKETATSNDSHTVSLDGNISGPKTIEETTITRTASHNFNYHYTISNAYGFRKGILSVSIDGTNVILDDSFSINATPDKLRHIFSGTVTVDPIIAPDVTFKLSYTTSDTESVNFSYMIAEEYHHHT